MQAHCRIELFGGLRVIQGSETHTRFRTHKAALLLAYLALNKQQAHPRERLLERFWPEMEPEAARDNLSTALSQLRRQFEPTGIAGGGLLLADRQQVRLNADMVETDTEQFEGLVQEARNAPEPKVRLARLQEAVALYRGELLPGYYEDWALQEQNRFQSLFVECLRFLLRGWEEAGSHAEALDVAQRLTRCDPYDESGWQAQMRLLVGLRRPSAALQAYDSMEQVFARELGAKPSARTREMAEMIRGDPRVAQLLRAEARGTPRPSDTAPTEAPDVTPSPVAFAPSFPAEPSVAPPIPLPLTRFFGRQTERDQIAALLQTPDTRLVSILGPGGAGKTRLALEVAVQIASAPDSPFTNRVWFVSLADIPDASLIAPALINALRLPSDSRADPLDRVVAFFEEVPALLVLDNMEHLLREAPFPGKSENAALSSAAGLVRLLLERVPRLTCLTTSRQALRLGGEQEYALPPLATPEADAPSRSSLESLLQYGSIALYVDRARAARPDFALTAQNAPAVAALCRRLEGMPLAVEMAAAWVKTIPPSRMLERLEHQLDLLVSRRRDLPPRHQSLRATIEWSYDLLAPSLQKMFARLGVFRGGWTLEAAEAVGGTTALHALIALQEHSLVVPYAARASEDRTDESAERYRMLEPLREFALEKLAEGGETAMQSVYRAHAEFFNRLADEGWMELDRGDKFWLDCLEAEHDNTHAALTWLETNDPDIGLNMAGRLWRLWELRGHVTQGRAHLHTLLARCGSEPPTLFRAQGRQAAGALAKLVGDYTDALCHYDQMLRISEALDATYYIALAKQQCGLIAEEQGDLDTASVLLEEAISLYAQENRLDMVANNQSNLAVVAISQQDYACAESLLMSALAIQRDGGDQRSVAITLCNLGDIARRQSDTRRSQHFQYESLKITVEIGNQRGSAYALEAFADIALSEGKGGLAAYFWGVAQALREANSCPLTPSERAEYEAQVACARSQTDAETFADQWNAGHGAGLSEAVRAAGAYCAIADGNELRSEQNAD